MIRALVRLEGRFSVGKVSATLGGRAEEKMSGYAAAVLQRCEAKAPGSNLITENLFFMLLRKPEFLFCIAGFGCHGNINIPF